MSDQRTESGSPADRKVTTTVATATGAAAGVVIGLSDWLFIQCFVGGHWHYVPPSEGLVSTAAPIILLPVALWFANIFTIIGDIITNRLRRAE